MEKSKYEENAKKVIDLAEGMTDAAVEPHPGSDQTAALTKKRPR